MFAEINAWSSDFQPWVNYSGFILYKKKLKRKKKSRSQKAKQGNYFLPIAHELDLILLALKHPEAVLFQENVKEFLKTHQKVFSSFFQFQDTDKSRKKQYCLSWQENVSNPGKKQKDSKNFTNH